MSYNTTADSKAVEAGAKPAGIYPPTYSEASAPPPGGYSGYPAQGPGAPGAYPPVGGYPPAGGYPPPGQPQLYYPPGQPQPGAAPQTFVYVQPTPLTNPPNDYFGYSICVTLCCCWLIGLFAIMRSMECRTAIRMGNAPLAQVKSQETKRLANIGLGVGIGCIILCIVIVILRIVVFTATY